MAAERHEEAVVGFRPAAGRTLPSAARLTRSWLAARTMAAYCRGHRLPGRVLAERGTLGNSVAQAFVADGVQVGHRPAEAPVTAPRTAEVPR
ncbi:hypothetical protein [Nocardia gamkensis]|uniref:Uncharacterized protein n=1 Tax=Nocardia gamkensis TaxID=352869 RepID=A0A7X6R4X6_9NOCA|nr:hypothetical protein [Nocardia gamkensis]NKY28960.1 hypothetical protein [Nocardia gamkensis]